MAMSQFKISECNGYLLIQVARAHRAKAGELLARIGLYPGQEILIYHLSEKDGLTHSEIAALLDVTPATVSKIVDRMETAGLVERQTDPDDQRISHVSLTVQGRELCKPVEEAWNELERASFANNLTAEERFEFHRLLMKVLKNLT